MFARNIKTGNLYEIIDMECINCTNNVDGQKMVLYKSNSKYFVREQAEFFKKFEINAINEE